MDYGVSGSGDGDGYGYGYGYGYGSGDGYGYLSLIHISEPTRRHHVSRMPSSA